MRFRFPLKFVDLVLVEDQKVLDSKREGFDNLTSAFALMRGHKFTEFSQMKEVAARLSELFTKLLKGSRCAAKVTDN